MTAVARAATSGVRRSPPRASTTLLGWIFVVLLALVASPASGAIEAGAPVDAGASPVDAATEASSDAGAEAALAVDASIDAGATGDEPAVAELAHEAAAIRALTAGQLDSSVDPATLFEVSPGDDDAVRVDAERLRLLLREVDSDAGAARRMNLLPRLLTPGVHAEGADAEAPEAGIDARLWDARIDLDRARLAFYDLGSARRHELLAAHALGKDDAGAAPSATELREHTAEERRQAALREARAAHTEAERLVSTELARLLGVERAQAAFDADLTGEQKQNAAQADATLGWQRRALDAQAHPGAPADETYDDLRRALRSARDSLSTALAELSGAPSGVPVAGPDPLSNLGVDVDTSAARKERDRVDAEARRLRAEEENVRQQRAAGLFDEIDTLNGERLALLGALSPGKRAAVTGFTPAAWDQAESEARQLTLILRYHRHVIGQWLSTFRHPGRGIEHVLAGGALQILEWLLAVGAFGWWRRRATSLLSAMPGRAREADRSARLPTPSPATRGIAFVAQVHGPVEWLVLLFVLKGLLPDATQQLLEVRVVSVLVTWIFGGALVVDTINAVAGAENERTVRRGEIDTAALRLRSLRLVGRVVVVFGLILVISAMLVGRGTIYRWVFSTCWLASIPVLLVLVRWWREVVFQRTERVRKPSRVQRWVLAHRQGWASFGAATAGGAHLFGNGTARAARNWVGRFVITRRALAYLFRRQLGKLGEQTQVVAPITDAAFQSLGPEAPPAAWIAGDSDEALDRLARRIRDRKGGVVALVGERGMGKTSALARLRGDAGDTLRFDATSTGVETLRAAVAASVDLPPSGVASFEDAAAMLARSPTVHALLIDNAHRFVQPVMGGLAGFDALLAVASRHTGTTTWVFALDEVVWQFLARARGARPLFDEVIRLEPWTEARIVTLLQTRTEEAGLTPSFEHLLDPLPATADEIDKQEALAQLAADYYRLLWDSALGNPGVALDMWRRSLGADAAGKTAVRSFVALDTTDLERLPDATVFVLRAVLQLAPATADNIATGTLIRHADVADALRYAASRGYLEERDGGYRVTWTWFRALTVFLRRRHLLVTR